MEIHNIYVAIPDKTNLKIFLTFLLWFISGSLFSQGKFTGGKFCERGATTYFSHSVFDSLGNCFFIGHNNITWGNADTFNVLRHQSQFETWFGKWSYNAKANSVITKTHDSLPLVNIKCASSSNLSKIKILSAFDVYGMKVLRFRIFTYISDSEVVPVYSDTLTGFLGLDITKIDKVLIPGMDSAVITNTLCDHLSLAYAVPTSLVYSLRAMNKHYPEYRNKIHESVFTWRKPQLIPNGKYWLYLCDF